MLPLWAPFGVRFKLGNGTAWAGVLEGLRYEVTEPAGPIVVDHCNVLTPRNVALRRPFRCGGGDAQLRTLQRRVKDWRGVMARKLVYTASAEPAPEPSEKVELVLVGAGNRS